MKNPLDLNDARISEKSAVTVGRLFNLRRTLCWYDSRKFGVVEEEPDIPNLYDHQFFFFTLLEHGLYPWPYHPVRQRWIECVQGAQPPSKVTVKIKSSEQRTNAFTAVVSPRQGFADIRRMAFVITGRTFGTLNIFNHATLSRIPLS